MYRKGYLDQQIEELGRAMAKLLADLVGLPTPGETTDAVNELLQSELDLDGDQLAMLSEEALLEILKNNPKFDGNNLELLADLLAETARNRKPMLQKSLLPYRFVDAQGKVFSMERNAKINRLTQVLEQL